LIGYTLQGNEERLGVKRKTSFLGNCEEFFNDVTSIIADSKLG
jgi:hypothetical protein